jgi:hypothetical protein
MSKESTPHGHCPSVPLARNRVGAVAACPDCGHLQLVLEYLTLRFEPEAFRELATLLASAQQCLDRERETGEERSPDRAAAMPVVH